MARKLTSKQLDLYDVMRKKVMSERRKMIRRRRDIEESQGGRMNALPALVIPKRPPNRQYIMARPDPWKAYRKYMAQMRESLSATKEIRYNFFFALREMIQTVIDDIKFEYSKQGKSINLDVDFSKGKLKKEDIAKVEDERIRDVLEMYRELYQYAYSSGGKDKQGNPKRLGLNRFLDMYERGYIVQLRWIYNELTGSAMAGTFTEEQRDMLQAYKEMIMKGSGKETSSSTAYFKSSLGRNPVHPVIHKQYSEMKKSQRLANKQQMRASGDRKTGYVNRR